jgi:geranylgeranyl pyrophosphate synthase
MDGSEMRRGKTCWYLLPDAQNSAINDSMFIHSCISELVRNHFYKGGNCAKLYASLLDVFNDVNQKTLFGQTLDLKTAGFEKFVLNYICVKGVYRRRIYGN